MHRRSSFGASSCGFRRFLSVVCVAAALAGCGSMPGTGPSGRSFGTAETEYNAPTSGPEAADAKLPFVLVNADRRIIRTLSGMEDLTYFKGAFTDRSPPTEAVLGAGDVLRITIFEAGPGGLFVQSGGTGNGGNFVTLPDQEVDPSGRISVPYAGKDNNSGFVKAKGRRLVDIQNDIQQRLMNKAIEPQVIVTMVKRTSNLFSVMGDVNAPGRFTLEQGGTRMLDALSMAGGPRSNDYNTLVTLQRGSRSATARLSTLLTQSENNVFVQPNDLIAVKKDERHYNVMGATQTNSRIAFEAESVTLADAIAKAGGLNKDVAEPAMVVVFRREGFNALLDMGVDLKGQSENEPVPTVYRFDLTEPTGLFLAQKMPLRNDDVVYVSTHPFSDVSRLVGILRDVLFIKLINN
jgi:polysaccharide biosynthesis/export protein